MDWIEEKLAALKSKMRNRSLKTALSIYIAIAVFVIIVLYVLTMMICNSWEIILCSNLNTYDLDELSFYTIKQQSMRDYWISLVIYFVEKFAIVIYSIIAIIVTSHLFYVDRIKVPIDLLKDEADYISRDDLSVSCIYNCGDEFGDICSGIERMRLRLISNQQNVWNLMEAQRKLNSAFAHDIRTPLTVAKGYSDMIFKYYPQGKISDEKLFETLGLMQSQLDRISNLTNRMKDIQDIDSLEVKKVKTSLQELGKKCVNIAQGLSLNYGLDIIVENNLDSRLNQSVNNLDNNLDNNTGYLDENVILEVLENLLSNGVTFAKNKISVSLTIEGDYLAIYVSDDGLGFSKKELYKDALSPFYSNREKNQESHMGIGLTICNVLCQKHGGRLYLNNSTNGGAIISALFLII